MRVQTLLDVKETLFTAATQPELRSATRPASLHKMPVVEFSPSTSEEQLKNVTRFDYWSIGNSDEISKWLFPSSFIVWNLLYFLINFLLSGRA